MILRILGTSRVLATSGGHGEDCKGVGAEGISQENLQTKHCQSRQLVCPLLKVLNQLRQFPDVNDSSCF